MATMKESVTGMWVGMERGMRFVFVGAIVLILVALGWASYAVFRDDYGTLFSQLSDSDAASIVDALKRQKVPYRLAEGGTTIEVPADRVHETRLALMSSNVALSGGVGFEIFDKQGLGATEQSQHVSYQRALQGELARTISTLENVKQARVLLVLPESSLFKRDKQEATAAVTLTLKPGNTLERQQILGVQRLVAASVAGLDPSRVIITDQRGVTLSTSDPGNGSTSSVEARLELQRQIEGQIAHKISRMLDSAFGPGQAILSIAVALNFDAVKTTTQAVLPVRGQNGADEGDIVRKRQVVSGGNRENSGGTLEVANTMHNTNSTLEIEYEHGRRIEEVIAAPGAIKRITVGVIVPPQIGEDQQRRIKEFVQVAAGIDELRGDRVSIQSLALNGHEEHSDSPQSTDVNAAKPTSSTDVAPVESRGFPNISTTTLAGSAIAILLLGALVGALMPRNRNRALSEKERGEMLRDIRRALGDDARPTHIQAKQ